MNLIDRMFRELRDQKRAAFIPFLPAGDPDLEGTGRLLDAVIRNGADLVEIGFPYSDPIADGPVIQAAYTRALDQGLKTDQVFEAAAGWRRRHPQTPLAAMISFSLIHRRGIEPFLELAWRSGFQGAIVPDLPLEESAPLVQGAKERDFKIIQLVSPATPRDRAAAIARESTGFLYCISVTGITGARDQLPAELLEQLAWLRLQTDLPLCVGFGVSKPEHARLLRQHADGVIVGSALTRLAAACGDIAEAERQVGQLAASLRQALDEGR